MFEELGRFEVKKLKKILFSFGFAKKGVGALVLFTTIFGIIAPISAQAAWWDDVPVVGHIVHGAQYLWSAGGAVVETVEEFQDQGGIVGGFFNAILCGGAAALVSVTSLPLSLSHAALAWVTSDDFVSVSFTGGKENTAGYNEVVAKGWGIIRNLVNMFIVLGFVIVAIATILGIQEYNAQKLLPALIAIALLINFTPVICGLIIDASNIAMNHFLSGASLDRNFLETINFQSGEIMNPKSGLDIYQKFGYAFVYAGLNLVGTIIFGLFTILFVVRYIALWILVILSPLAFFCYVFPKSRGVWSTWWTQFFQWCIIGIPAAFFIYLSNILIAQMTKTDVFSRPTGEIATTGFDGLFTLTLPFVFMVIGLFASFKTGAMGANMITAFAKSTGKKQMAWMGKKALGAGKLAARGGAGWALSTKSGEKFRRWSERQAAARTPGAGEKGVKAKIKQGALFVPYALRRQIGRAITPIPGAQKAVAAEAYAKAKKQDAATNTSDFHNTIDPDAREGIISAMIEEKQMKYALDADRLRGKEITKGEMLAVYERSIDMKDKKTQEKIERSYIKDGWEEMEEIAKRKEVITDKDMAEKGHKDYRDVIIDGSKSSEDVKQLQKGFQKDEKILESLNKFWGGQQVGEAAKTFGREFVDAQQEFASENGPEWYLRPENFNTKIPNYMNSSTAQGIGFSSITGGERLEKTEIGRKIGDFKDIRKQKKETIDEAVRRAPLTDIEKDVEIRKARREAREKVEKITSDIKETKKSIKEEKKKRKSDETLTEIIELKEELKKEKDELKTKKIEMREGTLRGKAGEAGRRIKSKLKKNDENRFPY